MKSHNLNKQEISTIIGIFSFINIWNRSRFHYIVFNIKVLLIKISKIFDVKFFIFSYSTHELSDKKRSRLSVNVLELCVVIML